MTHSGKTWGKASEYTEKGQFKIGFETGQVRNRTH